MSLKRLGTEQAPAVGLAWLVSELFYKFHSFTLECMAFLATWFVIDMVIQLTLRRVGRSAEATESPGR
jgi:hypothetical protein